MMRLAATMLLVFLFVKDYEKPIKMCAQSDIICKKADFTITAVSEKRFITTQTLSDIDKLFQ